MDSCPEGRKSSRQDHCFGFVGDGKQTLFHAREILAYDVSLQVAEQRLLPVLRQAPADAAIVAPGFSCRTQIAHCLGRTALHPAQLLCDAVTEL